MQKLSKKEKQAVINVAARVDKYRISSSCLLIEHTCGTDLAKRYASFYNKKFTQSWAIGSKSDSIEHAREWRVLLLLWFAEVMG